MVAGGGATAASPGGHRHQGDAGGTGSRGCLLVSQLAISLPPVSPRWEATTLLPAAAAAAWGASCRTAAATSALPLQLTGWVKVVVHFFSSPL